MVIVENTTETTGEKPLFRLSADTADTAGELRKFAGRLGLCPKNLQLDSRGEYYLITPGWRSKAIKAGAISAE